MARKNPKGSEGKFARMIQREFASIHKRFDETASKQDLAPLREDLALTKEELVFLRKDTDAGFGAITHALKAIQEELKDLKGMDAELTALRLRVARVERKVGLTR